MTILSFALNELSCLPFLSLMAKEMPTQPQNLRHSLYINTYTHIYVYTHIHVYMPRALACLSSLIFYYSHKENLYSKETEVLKLPLNGRYFLSFQDATNTVSIAYNTLFWSPFFVEYQPILQSSAQAPPPNKALPGTSTLHTGEPRFLLRPPGAPLCLSPYSSASSLRTSVHTF